MPTEARLSFEENWVTIKDLMTLTGEGGRFTQPQRAARTKAAMVFCITAWEGYVEDAVREASGYLSDHCPAFSGLPRSVRQAVVGQVTPGDGPGSKSPSGHYPQDLADNGWRALLVKFAAAATEGSNFNTPKSSNVKKLFEKWCGVDVTRSWSWQRFAAPGPADRLDESINLRGSIIHTGAKPAGLNANWIQTYGESNIRQLVLKTDEVLGVHVNAVCGKGPGDADAFATSVIS